MAINYKKCPRCGSLNTIKIIYGMPTHDAFLMAEEGEIKLGGCCITDSDPEYYCKNCENEWDITYKQYFPQKVNTLIFAINLRLACVLF